MSDQGLLVHTPIIVNNEHSKMGPKFSVCAPTTLGLGGVTSRNFSTWRGARHAWQFGYNF